MRQSQLFSKTRREAPKDETAKNAELLIRGGFIHKDLAGVYSFLPLGLLALNKINDIIRTEMNSLGAVELELTTLQDKELWQKTNRWDDSVVDNWFKTKLKNGSELGLGFTHEEPLTNLMINHLSSYQDLPIFAYQIQTKFRNETRAKSGLMRGREFLMKDLYSFTASPAELDDFYERVASSYERIFATVGLGDVTFRTFASGGVFSKYSHEFQTLTEAGEDTIYLDEAKRIAVNQEVYTDEVLADLSLDKSSLVAKKAVEVGNIFKLGTRFSEALGLTYKDASGQSQFPIMGSYGLGPTRLLGTIVELSHDDKGIIWPRSVAPFKVHLVDLTDSGSGEKIYETLRQAGIEVLWDDRTLSAGAKFADADLIGLPYRLVISAKTGTKVELKPRTADTAELVSLDEAIALLTK